MQNQHEWRFNKRFLDQRSRDREKAIVEQQLHDIQNLHMTLKALEKKQAWLEAENKKLRDENMQWKAKNTEMETILKNKRINQLVPYCYIQESNMISNDDNGQTFWKEFLNEPEPSKVLLNLVSDFLHNVPDETILA